MSVGRIKNTELSAIAAAIRSKNGESTLYKPGEMAAAIEAIPTGTTPTGTVNISQNGTTDVTQYASANVNVPNSYAAADEGKVVSNGALVAQTSRVAEITQNGTYDTTLNNSVTVNVSGGGGDVLPNTYQEVEYLQTGSSATYARIPYAVRIDDVISMDVSAQDWGVKTYNSYLAIREKFSGSSSGQRIEVGVKGHQKLIFFGGSGTVYDGNDASIYSNGSDVLYGSVSDGDRFVHSIRIGTTMPYDRWLFFGAYATTEYAANTRLYSLTGNRADGTSFMKLVPCYRKADSACGFYELRTKTFFVAESGTFTAGPDVN